MLENQSDQRDPKENRERERVRERVRVRFKRRKGQERIKSN